MLTTYHTSTGITRSAIRSSFGRASCVAATVLALSAVWACKPASDSTLHPRDEFIARPIGITATLQVGSAHVDRSQMGSVVSSAQRAAYLKPIGAAEQPSSEVFGSLTHIVVDSTGRVFALDTQTGNVRVFDANGHYLATIGRPGGGPGEFIDPAALALDGTGYLLVGDLKRQVQVFAIDSNPMTYVRTIPVGVAPSDMCAMHGYAFIHGVLLGDTTLIRAINLHTNREVAFGSLYVSPSAIINYTIDRGHVACDARDSLVIFMSSGVPEIRAYRMNGRIAWATHLAGYKPTIVTELPNNGFSVSVPPDGYHHVAEMLALPHGRIMLQLAFSTRASSDSGFPFAQLRTFVLDARTGHGTAISDSLPLIASLDDDHIVEMSVDPFPQFRLGTLAAQRERESKVRVPR